MAGLFLQDVSKSFGAVGAVHDLSFEVEDGELLVLVGPSGCGKSTTLRLVAGLEDPDSGEISIGDRIVNRMPSADRNVAMVFQSYALFPHLTVFDNLAFGLAARRRPGDEIRSRVETVAETLGLTDLFERKPRQLSGGERQRVALGRAMVRNPDVFLMDEPLSNLDAQLRVRTRAEIVRLQSRLRTTTIYVTHDQAEALGIGHRIGVLRDGVLQQMGTPREVYGSPANIFVATFIGSPAMNIVPCLAQGDELSWSGGRLGIPDGLHGIARDVLVGVRPEHVHVRGSRWSATAEEAAPFGAKVDLVESVGDQSFLTLDAAGIEIVARVEPSLAPAPGSLLTAWFDPERLRLFDAASGIAL